MKVVKDVLHNFYHSISSLLKRIASLFFLVLFPYQGFIIKTHLNFEEVISKFSTQIEPRRPNLFFSTHKRYHGQITDKQFKVSKIIKYRNSALPALQGEVYPRENKTFLKITARLNLPVMIIVAVYYGFAIQIMFYALSGINNIGRFIAAAIILIALLFGSAWGVLRLIFYIELESEKQFLRKLFSSAETHLPLENEKYYGLAPVKNFNPELKELLEFKEWMIFIGLSVGISVLIIILG